MSRPSMRTAALCACLLGCLALPAGAFAGFAPGNDPVVEAEQLSATGFGTDAQGDSLVAWSEEATEAAFDEVRARRLAADGTLGPVIDLAPGQPGFRPAVAMMPSGRAFVAWRVIVGFEPAGVRGRWVEPDGSLGPIVTFVEGAAGVADAGNPMAVVDPAGVATVVWEDDETSTLDLRRVRPDSTLGPLVPDIASGEGVTNPVIAALPNGSTVAVWRGTEKSVVTADLQVSAPVKISETNGPGDNQLAVDGAGNVLVVWRQSPGGEMHGVGGRLLDPTGAAVGTELVIDPPQELFVGSQPTVSADSDGDFLVAWSRRQLVNDSVVFVRGVDSAGVFAGPPQPLSVPGVDARSELAALFDSGDGVAAWRDSTPLDDVTVGRSLGPLGVPSSGIEELRADTFGPELVGHVPDSGFAAFLVGYAVSGSAQGAFVRRFMLPPGCADSAATVVGGQPIRVPISCTGIAIEGAQVVSQPQHGTLGAFDQATRSLLYTPKPGFEGADSFVYIARNDGGAAAPARVTIAVGKDTRKPLITGLRLMKTVAKSRPPKVFLRGFRVTVDEVSSVRVKLEKRMRGVRKGGKCRKPGRAKSGKRCARFGRVGLLGSSAAATDQFLPIKGKLRKKLKKGGRFRATAIATDLAGNESKPRQLSFRTGRKARRR